MKTMAFTSTAHAGSMAAPRSLTGEMYLGPGDPPAQPERRRVSEICRPEKAQAGRRSTGKPTGAQPRSRCGRDSARADSDSTRARRVDWWISTLPVYPVVGCSPVLRPAVQCGLVLDMGWARARDSARRGAPRLPKTLTGFRNREVEARPGVRPAAGRRPAAV